MTVEIWRGGVNTWECDEMGHLNVRFYVALALEGLAGLALELGQPCAFSPGANATLKVKEHQICFLREARAGDSLYMTGGVVEIAECEAVLLQLLFHADGQPCASFTTRVVHATPTDDRGFAWPERAHQAGERLRVDVPDFARARGLEDRQDIGGATLKQAEALGMSCIGRGVVGADSCDVFGRMTADRFMGRISDGLGGLLAPFRAALAETLPEVMVGGVALEYRLTYADLPRAGEHIDLRSGLTSFAEKVQKARHWLLDPVSGRAWATAESVFASFDLQARRIIPYPSDLVRQFQALVLECVEGGQDARATNET